MEKAKKTKDLMERDAAMQDVEFNPIFELPRGLGWPIDNMSSGLPNGLDLVMQVDVMGRFGFESSLIAFQSKLGQLPARATLELTKQLYRTTVVSGDTGNQLPNSIFLAPPQIMSEYMRYEAFQQNKNSMEGFQAAGTNSKISMRFEKVLASFDDPIVKMDLKNKYTACNAPQFKSMVFNGSLRSSATFWALKNIEAAESRVCGDLVKLVDHVFEVDRANDITGDLENKLWSNDVGSLTFWEQNITSTYLRVSWMTEQMHKRHNDKFFQLTAANLKIVNDTMLGSIMYRLGQHNIGFTYMGMPTIVCDGMGKLQIRTQTHPQLTADTTKKPSAGYDFGREVLDTRRISHIPYNNLNVVNDDSKITQLKKVTPNAMQTGFVMFVKGEIEQMPDNELAKDCNMPEGPGDGFNGMCQLLTAIPRDGDNDSELWTTVDKDKTNIRDKAMLKLIQGFSLYLISVAKNFLLDSKAEQRFRDLSIVCNMRCSSGPIDVKGMWSRGAGEMDRFENSERAVDVNHIRRGIIHTTQNSKSKKKGEKPTDADQIMWAPLHYFAMWISGILVGMVNKMGSWTMYVDYGVKCASDYLYNYILDSLQCLITGYDNDNASRYYESFLCRQVADSVYKTTIMHMLECKDVDTAVFEATRSLSYNPLPMCELPVVMERMILRLVQYEPFMAMATLGISLKVPVVSVESMLELFDGKRVSDDRDREKLKRFVAHCWANNMFVNHGCLNGGVYGSPKQNPIPYITSAGDWDSVQSNIRQRIATGGEKRADNEVMKILARGLYSSEKRVLESCAFCKSAESFQNAVSSLTRTYDFRKFFGGMSCYQNSKAMISSLGLPFANNFPENFMDDASIDVDPCLFMAQISADVYSLTVRVWDILFWMAIMRKPRRDFTVMEEVALTLTTWAFKTLPRSIFPHDYVPMTRLDPMGMDQVVLDLTEGENVSPRPETIIRHKNPAIVHKNYLLECEGKGASRALEDEGYMSSVFMLSEKIGCLWQETPLTMWNVPLQLEMTVCYPFIRYKNCVDWDKEGAGASKHTRRARKFKNSELGYLFANPTRCSYTFFVMAASNLEEFATKTQEEIEGGEQPYEPDMCLVQEFTTAKLEGYDDEDSEVTMCRSPDHCINQVYECGFGPCPFFRRRGVLLNTCYDPCDDLNPEKYRLGCLVPHRDGLHGCLSAQHYECYLCTTNPFYEVVFDDPEKPVRVLPDTAYRHVVPVGATLLLDIASEELKRHIDDASQIGRPQKRVKRSGRKNSGAPVKYMHQLGVPSSSQQQEQQEQSQHGSSALHSAVSQGGNRYLRVKLNVSPNIEPPMGMIYVTVLVKYTNNTSAEDVRGLYVRPGDLRIPVGEEEHAAMQYVVV